MAWLYGMHGVDHGHRYDGQASLSMKAVAADANLVEPRHAWLRGLRREQPRMAWLYGARGVDHGHRRDGQASLSMKAVALMRTW